MLFKVFDEILATNITQQLMLVQFNLNQLANITTAFQEITALPEVQDLVNSFRSGNNINLTDIQAFLCPNTSIRFGFTIV